MKSEPPRTVFHFKIRTRDRKTASALKTLVQGVLILAAVALFFAAFAAVQVKLCQDKYPKRTATKCLFRGGTVW